MSLVLRGWVERSLMGWTQELNWTERFARVEGARGLDVCVVRRERECLLPIRGRSQQRVSARGQGQRCARASARGTRTRRESTPPSSVPPPFLR